MRGKHCVGQHYVNHHRLAKRVSAFGLALAVICGCLTPVFASQPELVAAEDTTGAVAMDGGIALPVAGGGVAVDGGSSTVTQPTITTRTDADGNIITEYDWGDSQTVWKDDEAVISRPEQGMDELDPAFGVSTVTYRFWLDRLDAYTLEQLALDAEAAGLSETEYLAQFGSSKQFPLYHIDTIADTAYIGEYPFDQPTALDDPEGLDRTFAGWYTVDDLGIEWEFDPDDASYKASSDVVDVYAKWTDTEQPSDDTRDETKDDADAPEEDTKTEQKTVDLTASTPILNKTATASVAVQGLPGTAKTLNVFELDDAAMEAFGEAYQKTLNGAAGLTPVFGLEIAPQDAKGATVQPNGPVTVTITGLNGLELSAVSGLKVLHQTASGVETLDARYGNGILSFETTSFSPFVLAAGVEESIDTEKITGKQTLLVGSYIKLTSDNKNYTYTRNHEWKATSGAQYVTITPHDEWVNVEGESIGSAGSRKVTIQHKFEYYKNSQWRSTSETYNITVKNPTLENATVFVLKTPTSDRTSNAAKDWGYGILGAKIDVTGGSYNGKNLITSDLPSHIISWPDNKQSVVLSDGTVAWKMPLDTIGWSYPSNGTQTSEKILDQIWNAWSEQIKKDTGIQDLSKDNIKELYLVPYKISKNGKEGTITPMHIDCEIRPVYQGIFVARFHVTDTDGTEKMISAKNYAEKDSTGARTAVPENNGQEYRSTYPLTKQVGRDTYVFDGWYNEAGEKVTSWTNYRPSDTELSDGVVDFYAHYTKQVTSLTISKTVNGLLGEHNRRFEFTVEGINLSDYTCKLNGKVVAPQDGLFEPENNKIWLKHNDVFTVEGISPYITVTVSETAAAGYETLIVTSSSLNSYGLETYDAEADSAEMELYSTVDTASADKKFVQVYVPKNGATVAFTNTKDFTPDTGVILDTLPYLLILAVVVGGGALLILHKRRSHDDDE